MQKAATPLTAFHSAIRAIIDDEDQEVHTAYKITEKIKVVLNTGQVPGYKISADDSSVEPALTPDTDQNAYALLIKKTALMFRRSLTEDQIFAIENEIHQLENGSGFSAW